MPSVSPIYALTSIIYLYDDDECLGNATGFFFEDKEKNVYLVTNKHIIYGEKYYENPTPIINKVELILHTNIQNLLKNEKVIISLFKDGEKNWLEHNNKNVDVVLIPLKLDKKYVLSFINESWLDSTGLMISFEKIFIMGYPYGWYDHVNNLPITRIGHLSSPFKVPFRGTPIMLGDVETHKGMSGAPVLMHLEDFIAIKNNKPVKKIGAYRNILVGVLSGKPPWKLTNIKSKDTTEIIPHSLVYIWFPELILEILNANKK